MSTLDFYAARAAQCRAEADGTELVNVRGPLPQRGLRVGRHGGSCSQDPKLSRGRCCSESGRRTD